MYTEPVDSNTGGHNVGELGVKPPRLHDYWHTSNMQGCYFYRVFPNLTLTNTKSIIVLIQ